MTQATDTLAHFKKMSKGKHWGMATPWEVRDDVLPDAPITSVRRTMSDLTEAGLLRKTGYSRPGPKGAWCRCWILTGKGQKA